MTTQHAISNVVSTPSLAVPNAIRKRKVKFAVQLNIQELLSVPYINGVMFCKVRLCQGGSHVSYSSKKEVSNSSVSWSNDPPIKLDIKAVQLYTLNSNKSSITIVGYEPCVCRVSVRKEQRGGKTYHKLGYVDYNLTDYIMKHEQDAQFNEFCVNRILKEYENVNSASSATKKNHQRLDNSYLKINIKIIESFTGNLFQSQQQPVQVSNSDLQSKLANGQHSTSIGNGLASSVHSRNSSSSNSILLINSQKNNFPTHNRTCSNGSIKSNMSFDFLVRSKKLIDDIQSTTSSSSSYTPCIQTGINQLNINCSSQTPTHGFPNQSNFLPPSLITIEAIDEHQFQVQQQTNSSAQIESTTNSLIAETRFDASEIINQIENDLLNKNVNSSNVAK